ncbi:prepilin-type N-terminal cleavage/methylation domain-containing protein [Succinimonas sp.]|uniref:type IV pilus modification PilV family protein n=1 Tax=Succinimonas sp. TaxID=1936151 RepID=UPI003866B596
MKIRCKGFTLIELLVSMLVVAIAMLGFAALQTFSSRSLSSTAFKQYNSDALNAYVRFIESSRASIDTFKWGASNNQVSLTCNNINDTNIFSDDEPSKAFKGTFNTLCDQYIRNRSDLLHIDFAVLITRNLNVGGINGLTTYNSEVALVYQPVPDGLRKDVGTVDELKQEEYCPFSNVRASYSEQQIAEKQKSRAANNVVCNNVELSL